MIKSKFTDEEKQKIIANIQSMRHEYGVTEASKRNGITDKTYYNWTAKLKLKTQPKTKRAKPFYTELPTTTATTKLACVIGQPTEIAELLRTL